MGRITPRPFLKWVGGKGQLLNKLVERTPPRFGVYHEPFLGGGAFYFALQRMGRIQEAHLADLNWELIDTFQAVRDHPEAILARLEKFRYTETFFYNMRRKNPKRMKPVNRAARMIFLNKTCFNGLYRVNQKGKFNVPFGRFKNPKYRDPDNLLAVSAALSPAKLHNAPFHNVLDRAKSGDFVYFDPPYIPASQTANFTSYHAKGFTYIDHIMLRDVARQLSERGVYVMLSNSATALVRDLYGDNFILTEIKARRTVNRDPTKRGKVGEYLISNYAVGDVTFS